MMKAMLLAAGLGRRLAPLTDSTPKILAPIDGRPLLAHQLEYLVGSGVSEIAINVHHHAEQVLACLETLHPQVPVTVSHERELLGTAGALAPLRHFFSEPAIVLYGDVLTDASLLDLMQEHRREEPLATLAVYSSRETAGKGIVRLAGQSRQIEAFVEKPSKTPKRALINAGLYIVSPGVLDLIPPGPSDFGRDVWPQALAQGHVLRASILPGYVRDIGSPAALAGAQRNMAAGARSW